MKRLLPLVATAIAVLLVGAAPATADDDDFRCVGAATGTFDNVVVPRGATCTLSNSVVRGNVVVHEQGALYAITNDIFGNVEATKPRFVWLDNNQVGGRVWAKETGPAPDALPIWFCRNDVAGNIQVEKIVASFGIILGFGAGCPGAGGGNTVGGNLVVLENVIGPTIGGLIVVGNQVRENLQVFKNMGPGPKHVNTNIVGANLQCFENEPPFAGGPNVAAKAEGQCF